MPVLFKEFPSADRIYQGVSAWANLNQWVNGPPMGKGKDLPRAPYYDLHLTFKTKVQIRPAITDLWEEGVIEPLLDATSDYKSAKATKIKAVTYYWAVKQLEMEQVVRFAGVKDNKEAYRLLELGLHTIVANIRPKRLRDELIRAAMGERVPHFTREEVEQLRSVEPFVPNLKDKRRVKEV